MTKAEHNPILDALWDQVNQVDKAVADSEK